MFYRHECHPAFWAISRVIGYDFGMHLAGVFLLFLLLVLVIVIHLRAIEVNRPYLRGDICRDRDSHRYEQD